MRRVSLLARVPLGAFVLLLAVGIAKGGPTPAQKCEAAKIKSAGKEARCLLNVYSAAAAKGGSPDSTKVQKCKDALSKRYTKLEAKGTCTTSGDTGAIEGKVDAFAADVNSELVGGGTGCTPGCLATGQGCTADAECCSLTCNSGSHDCGCAQVGGCCTGSAGCCSGQACVGGRCPCVPSNGACGGNSDCCSNSCDIAVLACQ